MLDRFAGEDGSRRLLELFARQRAVNGDRAIAQALAEVSELFEFEPGGVLIHRGGHETDVFFIISGRVAVEINGTEVAVRSAGSHVGEMAAIDTSAPRSANVRALEATTAARVAETDLAAIARAHPALWRNFAVELAARLRERTRFFRVPNERPQMFIGSSVEMLSVAQELQSGLSHDDVSVVLWTDGVFRASRDAITNLLEIADRADFAVLVLGPDDVVRSRGDEQAVPRDNVVFELGLFIGAVGRGRTFVVQPREQELRIPTDLLGLAPIKFRATADAPLASRVGPVCTKLRSYVTSLGVR